MVFKILLFVSVLVISVGSESFKTVAKPDFSSLKANSLHRTDADSITAGMPDYNCFYVDSGTGFQFKDGVSVIQSKSVVISRAKLVRALIYKTELDSLKKIDSLGWSAVDAYVSAADSAQALNMATAKSLSLSSEQLAQQIKRDRWKPLKSFFGGAGIGVCVAALIVLLIPH